MEQTSIASYGWQDYNLVYTCKPKEGGAEVLSLYPAIGTRAGTDNPRYCFLLYAGAEANHYDPRISPNAFVTITPKEIWEKGKLILKSKYTHPFELRDAQRTLLIDPNDGTEKILYVSGKQLLSTGDTANPKWNPENPNADLGYPPWNPGEFHFYLNNKPLWLSSTAWVCTAL
jgi:hypothetical protein